jgi:ribosome-associated translation inhibitor RaiA
MTLQQRIDVRVRLADTGNADALKARIQRRLDRSIGHWSDAIRHADVRFEDVNGRRGGIDTACSVTVALKRAEPIVVKARDTTQGKAFALVVPKLERTLRRDLERRGVAVGRTTTADPRTAPLPRAPSLIGRREGRGPTKLRIALARPEKRQRNLFTDTSQPGVSETDRRAGGGHSARRNTRKPSSKMTVTLEDSLGRPSRKSSRRSKGRGKPSHGKERVAVAKAVSPKVRRQRR